MNRRIPVMLMLLVVIVLIAVPHPLEADEKVTVCHQPGMPYQQTLEIDEADVDDHLAHGDLEGQCALQQETVVYVCSTSGVEYETLYVSSEAWAAQNGTVEWPFGSVSSALQYAEKMDFPGAELQIEPGVYGDDAAALSRPTRIVGPGQNEDPSAELHLSIMNDGAIELGVQGVVFRAAGSGPAITVTDPAADTALCDVRFEGVIGHALLQTGGAVYIEGGVFDSTARDPGASDDDHLTGTAIVLAGGVTGSIADIHVDGSSGSGLYVSGAGTRVDVDWERSSQSVFENGTGCLGAVVVNGGAELNASNLTLDGNGVAGISVEGSGTTGSLPFLTATSTQYLESGPDGTLETCGFNAVSNVVARSGARLNITGSSSKHFTISDSAFAGLMMSSIDPLDPTEVSLSDGEIRNCPVGASIDANSCDSFSFQNVSWENNEVDRLDPSCLEPEPPQEVFCGNGLDDDSDGFTDCADSDCALYPSC